MKIDNTFLLYVSLALIGAPIPALAQQSRGGGDDDDGNNGGGRNSAPAATRPPAAAPTGGDDDDGGNAGTQGGNGGGSARGGAQATDAPNRTQSGADSEETDVAITGGGDAAETEAPPALTTSRPPATETFGGAADTAGPADELPTIVGVIQDYVAQVPPTAKNPFMQKSNLPEGTVFIAVGSALGLIGLICIAWRAIVAWSLRRNLRRSAMENHYSDSKTMLGPSGGNASNHGLPPSSRKKSRNSGMYTSQYGSSLSLDHLANGPGGGSNRGNNTPNSSLFFSPTAGSGAMTPGNRGSGYLPAGYYASGANSSQTNLNTPRRPNTAGTMSGAAAAGGATGPSPPNSPLPKPPSRGRLNTPHDSPRLGTSHSAHSSLHAPPGQQRTPSTYLEDLFESHPPPSSQGNRDSMRDSYGGNGGSGRSRHSQYGRNH